MFWNKISINTVDIPQSDLNVDVRVRKNLFSWSGQFSPQFVEAEISRYSDKGFRVLDPFAGSGTTLYECARKGLEAYGVELNPSAYYMAKVYELVVLDLRERNALLCAIETDLSNKIPDIELLQYILYCINSSDDLKKKNILSVLVILMDIFKNKVTYELMWEKWDSLKEMILRLPYSLQVINAVQGDARNIGLDDNFIDLLFTSPPYINVFNYHQNYRRSAESLGYDILKIAKSEFGANRKNRGNRFLTVIQYCIDMAQALLEASRVCKPNSRMIYVVGRESAVLGCSFYNSEIIYSIGTEIIGLSLDIRQERVFKNRYGQLICEDILHFLNTSVREKSQEQITCKARKVAIKMLKNCLEVNSDDKNVSLILEAIRNAGNVQSSEVFFV